VTGHEEDRERSQQIKSSSVSELVRLFDKWVVAPKSFEEDVRDELTSAASVYLKLYVQRVQRIAAGDFMGSLILSSDAEIIEGLMLYDEAELGPEDRIKRIQQFFQSDYYAEMPIERISSELFAMLRQHVRAGQHANRQKAIRSLSGIFFDIVFISTYAPYCDAMVIDNTMHDWVSDPKMNLTRRFGTKFFCRHNWREDYLTALGANCDPWIEAALRLVHPADATSPDWAALGLG